MAETGDDLWEEFWRKRTADAWDGHEAWRAKLLHLIRERSPTAFQRIVASDADAASIAVRRRWLVDSYGDMRDRLRAEWLQPEAVRAAAAAATRPLDDGRPAPAAAVRMALDLLGGLLRLHAPENLPLLAEVAVSRETPANPFGW